LARRPRWPAVIAECGSAYGNRPDLPKSDADQRHDALVSTLDEAAIARLLLRHWDVLGVADTDVDPESEYRHEAAEVFALLRSGSGPEEIAAHLGRAAKSLNASRDAMRDHRAARLIFDAHRK
jgi:hypothetical protein